MYHTIVKIHSVPLFSSSYSGEEMANESCVKVTAGNLASDMTFEINISCYTEKQVLRTYNSTNNTLIWNGPIK